MKPKIIVLTGPTAAGKTSLSLSLANKFNAEVISADSKQVYKGLDVGTDKIKLTNNRSSGIRHHLIDVAGPRRTFTVAQYKKLAKKAIKQILKRGRVPMIVGGSPFYIEALIYDLNFPEVKPNQTLRKNLKKKSTKSLLTLLKNLDPERAGSVDPSNRVRLFRAIEIAKTLGKIPPLSHSSLYTPLILGLNVPDKILRQRINHRVDKRFSAIAAEIKSLRRQKLSFKRLVSFGLEYRYVSWYLVGKIDKKEATEKSKIATWQFARRQKTYFKRLPIVWIKNQRGAETKIKKFLD